MANRPFWSAHTHSRFSVNDALPMVEELVVEAAAMGYPALGLTDHGSVAGNVQLYRSCRKEGIEPLPGVELYLTDDRETRTQGHNRHLTVLAYSETGYRNLCRMITRTAKNFYYKPRIDIADLAEMSEELQTQGLAVATGCWFGLVPTIVREQGVEAAEHMVKTLAGWFPRVYVELQNHGIEEQTGDAAWIVEGAQFTEEHMVDALVGISERTGVPHIITTDAHYIAPKDQRAHEALKELASWSDSPDDAVFPGEAYCLRDEDGMKPFFEPRALERSLDNLAEFAGAAAVRIPELDTFRALIPDVSKTGDPMAEYSQRCEEALHRLYDGKPKAVRDKAWQRHLHEADVLEITGLADYLLLTASVADYMRENHIVFNTRGSANDWFGCYLLGITNVNAHEWGLRPERFISVDRTAPPDVDFDVEHERRKEVVAWAATQHATCQVGTIMKYSLFAEEGMEDESSKGSLRARYFTVMNKQGSPVKEWKDVPLDHQKMLWDLSDRKLISGYGTHPAGIIMAPDPAAISDLPMVRIGSDEGSHLVTAYGKSDVEDLGFIKMDLLGLRTLTAVRVAVELIAPGTNPIEYLESIPLTDSATYRRISAGKTDGTFQLSGRSAMDGIRRMKATKIGDVIAAMALFRPAAQSSGTTAEYLARRKKTDPVPAMHPDLEAETRNTYGLLLYQEQVIGVLRTLRMEMPELNKLLKAVKASNEYTAGAKLAIQEALPRIRELAHARDWSEKDIAILVDAISGYADYGFNEAHAVAYGLLAYRTNWLAEHHPYEWWTGVLTAYANHKLEPMHVRSARRFGVRIVPAHVNRSEVSYGYDRQHKAIRKGLVSIKGVGLTAATELAAHAPYQSLVDLGQRVVPRRVSGAKKLALKTPPHECGGIVAALYDADALVGVGMEEPNGHH